MSRYAVLQGHTNFICCVFSLLWWWYSDSLDIACGLVICPFNYKNKKFNDQTLTKIGLSEHIGPHCANWTNCNVGGEENLPFSNLQLKEDTKGTVCGTYMLDQAVKCAETPDLFKKENLKMPLTWFAVIYVMCLALWLLKMFARWRAAEMSFTHAATFLCLNLSPARSHTKSTHHTPSVIGLTLGLGRRAFLAIFE